MPFRANTSFLEGAALPRHLVYAIRQRFAKEAKLSPRSYHSKDIERVTKEDWPIERFLLANNNRENEAFEALVAAMKWRKSFDVNDLQEDHFPIEFYRSAMIFVCGKDRYGGAVVTFRSKVHKRIKSWAEVSRKYFTYIVEKVDRANQGKGMSLIIDCRQASIETVDPEGIKFLIQLFRDYYPCLLNVCLVYKLHSFMDTIYKLLAVCRQEDETIKRVCVFVSEKNIYRYIEDTELPTLLGGRRSMFFREVPMSAPTSAVLARKLQIKESKANKFNRHYEQYYNA